MDILDIHNASAFFVYLGSLKRIFMGEVQTEADQYYPGGNR